LLCGADVAAASGEDLPIAGEVSDGAGQPVAEADVWLISPSFTRAGESDVLSRDKTDAAGKFRLTLPVRWSQIPSGMRQELGICAAKGRSISGIGFDRTSIPPRSGLRLVLADAARFALEVHAPDASPVAEARVSIEALALERINTDITEKRAEELARFFRAPARKTPYGFSNSKTLIPLPPSLVEKLNATTDAAGKVMIAGVAAENVGIVRIVATPFGEQAVGLDTWRRNPLDKFPSTVQLKPVGRLSGTIAGPRLADALDARTRVFIHTFDTPEESPIFHRGSAIALPDAQGRFEVSAISQGRLAAYVAAEKPSTLRARPPVNKAVVAGRETVVEIPLDEGVRLRGEVRDAQTKEPLAGFRVAVGYGNQVEEAVTDAVGRYECRVPPGQTLVQPLIPQGYLPITSEELHALFIEVPAAQEFDAPPIALHKPATIRGTVLDDAGKPAAGASVETTWMTVNQRFGSNHVSSVELATDDRGEFSVPGADPRVEVRLRASFQGTFAVRMVPGKEVLQPLTLRLSSSQAVRVSGHVMDDSGRPVTGAELEIWQKPWHPPPFLGGEQRKVALAKGLLTDDAGRFTSPPLMPEGAYRVVARAAGVQTAQSEWLEVKEPGSLAFPDLVVRRVREVAGVVRDSKGAPIGAARVIMLSAAKRTETQTDADGRFVLPAVPGFAMLFVRAPGCRFHGELLAADAKSLDRTLVALDESPRTSMKTLAPAVQRDERLKLARAVVEPYLARVLGTGNEEEKGRLLYYVADVDPQRVLDVMAEVPLKDPEHESMVRFALVRALAPMDREQAVELAESLGDAHSRAWGYLFCADAVPDGRPEEKLAVIAQALVSARAVKEPEHRVTALGAVGERLLDLGDRDRATEVLREGQRIAQQLATSAHPGFARGAFAEELAQIDLPAALELTRHLAELEDANRHHGNMAHELAAKNPAAAEQVLDLIRPDPQRISYRDQFAFRVCYRMAPVDLARAERIAGTIGDGSSRAYALGVMASALAAKNKPEAERLLRQAFGVLDEEHDVKQPRSRALSVQAVAGCLLPAAEAIDAALVPEFFWRAAHYMLPRPDDEAHTYGNIEANAGLAMLLARYDATVGGAILETFDARRAVTQGRSFLTAIAILDPKRAVKVIESVEDEKVQARFRLELARILASRDSQWWRMAHRATGVWPIDVEDLFW
jgi:hypothetical protein